MVGKKFMKAIVFGCEQKKEIDDGQNTDWTKTRSRKYVWLAMFGLLCEKQRKNTIVSVNYWDENVSVQNLILCKLHTVVL